MRCSDTGLNETDLIEDKLMDRPYLIAMVIAVAAMLLLAPSCTTEYWPTITSLAAEADWTAPAGSLRVTCIASSPNGGGLSYEWSASGGDIVDTGPVAEWTAPEQVGMYDITVVITNAQGRSATGSVSLIASNGPPPIIRDLVVTAKEHEYLKEAAAGYTVAKTYEYYIECIASDTSGELVYEWSCDGGEILGEGSLITWTAPDKEGDVTVTAKVLDSAGNWVRKSIVFDVVSCEACVSW